MHWQPRLNAPGIERGARCGYPVGISYPPDWGERTISLREEDQTILEPNMTFHFMPGLWMQDWGMEITETIRIRESGACRMPMRQTTQVDHQGLIPCFCTKPSQSCRI